MIIKSTRLWLTAAALAISSSALADTVTVNWANPVISPGPSDAISWSGSSAAGSGSAGSGRFHGSVTAFTGTLVAADFVDSTSDLYAYCYDLLQYLHSGTYTVDYTIAPRTLDFLGAVNYVLNGNSNTWVDPYAWLHPANAAVGAAVQAGIWESLYDTSGFELASGNFRLSHLEAGAVAQYALFKTAVADPGVNDLPSSLVMRFVSGDNQDVITARDPPPPPRRDVPEPGTLLLTGLGVALAGWRARR